MADVARLMQAAADKMFKTFEQLKVNGVLTNINEYEYNPLEQSVANTTTVLPVEAIKTRFTDKEVDGIKILQSDIKFLIMNNKLGDFEITTDTGFAMGGKIFNIMKSAVKGINTYTVVQARGL